MSQASSNDPAAAQSIIAAAAGGRFDLRKVEVHDRIDCIELLQMPNRSCEQLVSSPPDASARTCGLGTKFKRHDHQVLVLLVAPLLDHIQPIQRLQSWAAWLSNNSTPTGGRTFRVELGITALFRLASAHYLSLHCCGFPPGALRCGYWVRLAANLSQPRVVGSRRASTSSAAMAFFSAAVFRFCTHSTRLRWRAANRQLRTLAGGAALFSAGGAFCTSTVNW